MTGRDWHADAACLGQSYREDDPWYPEGEGGSGVYDHARAVCRLCPVTAECLRDALDAESTGSGQRFSRYRHGMRGGLTPSERDRLQRNQPAERRTA